MSSLMISSTQPKLISLVIWSIDVSVVHDAQRVWPHRAEIGLCQAP